MTELIQLQRAIWSRRRSFDLIHSFGRLAALIPVLPFHSLPKIQSFQRLYPPWESIEMAVLLARHSIRFTACSSSMFTGRPQCGPSGGRWEAIFNGVDLENYQFAEKVPLDAPLVFLGRVEKIKGAHTAISIARGASRRLIIAGNKGEDESHRRYFCQEIEPYLDGVQTTYVGPVDDIAKNSLLGSAAALLMPIEWDEPFGIVMAEAFACGTPVIAFQRGSVPEIIRPGINGFICSNVREAIDCVSRLGEIDRKAVRRDCEERFSHQVIADAYEQLYVIALSECS